MRYLNTLTGVEINVQSEIFAPNFVKIDDEPKKDEPVKKPTTKKGTKKK